MPHASKLLEGTTPDMPVEQRQAIVAINFNRRIAVAFRAVGNTGNAERAEAIAAERESKYLQDYGEREGGEAATY